MEDNKRFCGRCKKIEGKDIVLVERDDELVCPNCQTTLLIEGKSPLGRYESNWRKNAENIFVFVRPPIYQNDLNNPRLFFLYEECYHTLLIGKYNASIILLGTLLEIIMKERILLKLNIDFTKPYGACLQLIEKKGLMNPYDILFLRRFKDQIRNPYTHADEAQILDGIIVPVFPLEMHKELTLEKLEAQFRKVKSGEQKPQLMFASQVPALRSVVKQQFDQKRAIGIFNQVYDFLLAAMIKYFKQKEYDEHHAKFGTGGL
jgi:hypothetical protein